MKQDCDHKCTLCCNGSTLNVQPRKCDIHELPCWAASAFLQLTTDQSRHDSWAVMQKALLRKWSVSSLERDKTKTLMILYVTSESDRLVTSLLRSIGDWCCMGRSSSWSIQRSTKILGCDWRVVVHMNTSAFISHGLDLLHEPSRCHRRVGQLISTSLLQSASSWRQVPSAKSHASAAGAIPGSVRDTGAWSAWGTQGPSTDGWGPAIAFMDEDTSAAGCTAGPPVIGGRTADCCSASGSWAWRARASVFTMTLSFRNNGLSEMRCMLDGWLSTATAEMRGPASPSFSALIAAVQWAWTDANCDNCNAWSGLSIRANFFLHQAAFCTSVGPETRETTSHDGGTAHELHATSNRSAALQKRNSSRSASSPNASADEALTSLNSTWHRG